MLTFPEQYTPFDYESLTVTNAVKALTAATYAPANKRSADIAIITTEDDEIRYRIDGQADPSSTVGHKRAADSEIILLGKNTIMNFKAIRITTDAKIHVTYGRM